MSTRRLHRLQAATYPDWLRYGNLALGFFVELAALFGFGAYGALVTGWMQLVVGAVAVCIMVAGWAVFAAPRSKRRLKGNALLLFKLGVFAIATIGFIEAGLPVAGVLMAAASALHLLLALLMRQH